MRIDSERLKDHIEELGKIGLTERGGISRFSLTREDLDARHLIIEWMEAAGLEVRVDQAANIIGKRSEAKYKSPVIMSGSHIDTVPDGGRFDGAFGVLAAIEVAQTLNDQGVKTEYPFEAVVFTNEEGVRFPIFIGSKAMAGELDIDTLYSIKDKDGVTFFEALKSGYDPKTLTPARRKMGEVKAFIEAHIEQGPILDMKKIPIGVVSKIAGISHTYVTVEGQAGHAGTTPMSMRRDPLQGAAKIVLAVDETVKALSDATVGTVGFLKVSPGATNVIPGNVHMGIDIRDVDEGRMDEALNNLKRKIAEICSTLKLNYRVEEKSKVPPTLLSDSVVKTIVKASERLDLPYIIMLSGAGHDTMAIAKIAECAMIFIKSKQGKSHVPDEFSEWKDLTDGANVLLHSIADLSVIM